MHTRRFVNGTEVDVYDIDDVMELVKESDENKSIIRDAIDDLISYGSSRIKEGLAISIPYTVVVQRSILAEFVKTHSAEIHVMKKTLSKEEYKEKFINLYVKDKAEILSERTRIKHAKKIKERNNSLYKKYSLLYGLTYANTYMYCLSLCSIIPFDEEVEEMFQMFNNEKDRY